jgi:hypothetical protein
LSNLSLKLKLRGKLGRLSLQVGVVALSGHA